MTLQLRELINRAKGDGTLPPQDCEGPLADLVGSILDYGNHEARSLVMLPRIFADVQRKAKPKALALLIETCIELAFTRSRDGCKR